MIADAAARGSLRAYALGTAQRGLCRLRHGRLGAAEADARASLDVAESRSVVQTAVAAAALAGALTETGDCDDAAAVLDLVPADGRRPDTHVGAVVEDVRAHLYAAQGRWEEVLVATEACAAWERHFGVRHGGWPAWRSLAAAAHAALVTMPAPAGSLPRGSISRRPTASRAPSGWRCRAPRGSSPTRRAASSCCARPPTCWSRPRCRSRPPGR